MILHHYRNHSEALVPHSTSVNFRKCSARLFLCAAMACVAPAGSAQAQAPSSAQSPEARAVLAVVQQLFDAMRAKDTAAFRVVFEPGARLTGMRNRPTGEVVLQVLPWEQFAARALNDTRGEWLERAWSPEVKIRGTLATVWAEYDFHLGGKATHCGVDAVQLLKTPAGWKIVAIADTYETTGCPQRPAP
jgi:hypothetical protein